MKNIVGAALAMGTGAAVAAVTVIGVVNSQTSSGGPSPADAHQVEIAYGSTDDSTDE